MPKQQKNKTKRKTLLKIVEKRAENEVSSFFYIIKISED